MDCDTKSKSMPDRFRENRAAGNSNHWNSAPKRLLKQNIGKTIQKNTCCTTLQPKGRKKVSVKHTKTFIQLLNIMRIEPETVTVIQENSICFDSDFLIGSGSCGTEVYICLGSDGIERAIKRLPKNLCQKFLENERDILTSPNAVESPRIVNYWFYDEKTSPDFGYLILNLYEQNLEEFINEEGRAMTEARSRKMIYQVLEGLKALHSKEPRILHRDLKPTNILLDVNGDLALSDFGIGRFFPERGATSCPTTSERGSKGWVAYECINWEALCCDGVRKDSRTPMQFNWKEKSDIQVAGMIAFYIHTKGRHPFGPEIQRMMNLYNDNPVGLKDLSDPVIKDLIAQMLSRDLDKRPYVEQALCHPYFLSCDEQIEFLEAIGNEREIKKFQQDPCAVANKLDNLDPSSRRSSLLPDDWKECFNPDDFLAFCEGGPLPASYDGSRYTHCLRLVRNVRQHWRDKPRSPLKAMETATSLEEYFLQLFPYLPLVVHQIVRKHSEWRERPALKKYFPKINRRAEHIRVP